MIVTTGKIIKVDAEPFYFSCSSEHPGLVIVMVKRRGYEAVTVEMPANVEEAERFIAAYRRTIVEELGYREMKTDGSPLSTRIEQLEKSLRETKDLYEAALLAKAEYKTLYEKECVR